MYTAPIVIAGLIGLRIWRALCLRWEKGGKILPRWAQYYCIQYVLLVALLVKSFMTMHKILAPADWLDDEAIRQVILLAPGDLDIAVWEEEGSLEGYPALKWMSLSTPFWLVGTFIVCIYHTFAQSRACKGGLLAHPQRDETMTVLALPAVYCLMGFKALCHMWQIVVNYSMGIHGNTSFALRVQFYLGMYDSNFMVADVYEAMALLIFANLTLEIIERKVREQSAARPRGSSEDAELQDEVMHIMTKQSVSGVQVFSIACGFQAAYNLTVTSLEYFNHPIGFLSDPAMKNKAHYFFLGVGCVASGVAVQNILTVEHAFGERFLSMFSPSKKFWSAKVLVSLAFLQTLVLFLPPFSSWSETKQNIMYSSLICIECFFISLFHLAAWHHSEDWYQEGEAAVAKGTSSHGHGSHGRQVELEEALAERS